MKKMPRISSGTMRGAGAERGAGITLHRETLRDLDRAPLQRAAAGATSYCHSGD